MPVGQVIRDSQKSVPLHESMEVQVSPEHEGDFFFKQDKVRRFVNDLSTDTPERNRRMNDIYSAEKSNYRGHIFVDTTEYTAVTSQVCYKSSKPDLLKNVVTFQKVLPDGAVDYIKLRMALL